MVKTSKPKKCHKKSEKRGRISKKIKFIRHPNKTQDLKPESPRSISTKENTIINPENNAQIEYSLLNWSIIFLQQISCPLRNNKEFIQNFINIIKNLCINKNEFISWTMYIEFFLNKSCRKISWDKETLLSLLYIAIYTKKILDDKSKNNYGITINEKAIIRENVNIHKGVTIGQENRGKRKGVPIICICVYRGIFCDSTGFNTVYGAGTKKNKLLNF